MNILVDYTAQARLCAGRAEEDFEIGNDACLADLFHAVAERHGAPMRDLLFAEDGRPSRSILCFVGDEQADPRAGAPLRDGARVSLLSPVSGG